MKQIRDNYMVEIRKKHRKKELKRFREMRMEELSSQNQRLPKKNIESIYQELSDLRNTIQELLKTKEPTLGLIDAIRDVRVIVSNDPENSIPLKEFLRTDLSDTLIELLEEQYREMHLIQSDVLWTFINITGVADEGILFELDKKGLLNNLSHTLLNPKTESILDSALYILTNYAGTSTGLRDRVFEIPAFEEFLLGGISPYSGNFDVCFSAATLYSNCLRGPYHPKFDQGACLMQPIIKIAEVFSEDEKVQTEVCWALIYFVQAEDYSLKRLKMIVDSDYLVTFIKCALRHPKSTSALICLLKILTFYTELPSENEDLVVKLFDDHMIQVNFSLLQKKSKMKKIQFFSKFLTFF